MKSYIILRLIIAMLSMDKGGEQLSTKHRDHLETVAQAIYEVTQEKKATLEETRMLVAVAMRESRFGIPYNNHFPVSSVGACGIWQIRPVMFDPSTKTTYNESCADFKDVYYAATRGLESIRYWMRKKGRICHYNGGWRCRKQAKQYEKDIKRYMRVRPTYIARR